MSNTDGPRRDPRRLFSSQQRAQIASRQHQICSECGGDLPDTFHAHHVTPWAEGGLTDIDNGVAVCPNCHENAAVRPITKFVPKHWQGEALPAIVGQLRNRAFATVSAAPGAGKTLFAAWTYRQLLDAGDISRVVVFVPNTHLRTQWADEAKRLNVFLTTKGTTEKRSYDGAVLTYHALSDAQQVAQIIADADEQPTLFILDEVHHLAQNRGGEAGAWAVNIGRIVGNYDQPTHAVLNLSGTLFRSNRNEQISTIKYEAVEEGRIQTVADYAITAGILVGEKELRHIKVLGFDADMKVEAVELKRAAHNGADTIRAVDLDGENQLRAPVLRRMIRDEHYIHGILQETVSRLGHASTALENAPVKGLVIADGVEHAEQVHAALTSIIGQRHSFIAHGQMASADAEIERFRKSPDQGVLVAVQKVTEGFDVPDICVLTYLRTWRAPLFVNQMAGRAMRITDRERDLKRVLPATILIPNETEIKAAFADILVGAMNILAAPPEPCPVCGGEEMCVCPPVPRHLDNPDCDTCGFPRRWLCTCRCWTCGLTRATGCRCKRRPPRGPDVDLEVLGDGEVAHISIDGHPIDIRIVRNLHGNLEMMGIPEIFLEQAAAAMQAAIRNDPMTFGTFLQGDANV